MVDYHGKKVVIVGLGKTGLSCVDFFNSHQITPQVMDTRLIPPGKNKLSEKFAHIDCNFGFLNSRWLMAADLIVVSPGISLSLFELKQAANKGIEIIGDVELFCRETKKTIIAITGSNGKSTVAKLVNDMAKAANLPVVLGGNYGMPVLNLLGKEHELCILELSSFQLETTFSLKAEASTILNITDDHADRYPLGIKQYREAKLRIYDNAKFCIVNEQDSKTWPLCGRDARCISFGINSGDYQLIEKDQELRVNGKFFMHTNEIKLFGQHNYINSLAALALADTINIPREASLSTLKQYTGLPHRFQFVYEHRGIKWVNDSKATNIGSTTAALKWLKVLGTIYLLLGGDGKSADFGALKSYIADQNIKLCCFGRDGKKFAQLKSNSIIFETMEQCLRFIAPELKSGDMVLLSPACASFDQFINFEQRGEEFINLANELG